MNRTFVGFGFGPIQAGLFLYEAARSGAFDRLVVVEIQPDVVAMVRKQGGYWLNIARSDRVESTFVDGIEIYDPAQSADVEHIVAALAEATGIATALPSIDVYTKGAPSVAQLLMDGFQVKASHGGPPVLIYTAENHNHAAEALNRCCKNSPVGICVQFLNTVIGKMSALVRDRDQIAAQHLRRLDPNSEQAFLVEAFDRTLISEVHVHGAIRGFARFEEKPDLLPFEEAKLYGHNAVHALLGVMAWERGYRRMWEVAQDEALVRFAREAFLLESGAALIRKYAGVDPLFTTRGFERYADDLLKRMLNPHLNDPVERVIRDLERKLADEDRFLGTIRMIRQAGLSAARFERATVTALKCLAAHCPDSPLLDRIPAILQPPQKQFLEAFAKPPASRSSTLQGMDNMPQRQGRALRDRLL